MPCGGKKNEPPVQKVLIPKGMINPQETTIIEIPARLHKQPLVIAKRKPNGQPNNYTSEPYRKNTDWTRYEDSRASPGPSPGQGQGAGTSQMYDRRPYRPGGTQVRDDADCSCRGQDGNMWPSPVQNSTAYETPVASRSPRTPRNAQQDQMDSSYASNYYTPTGATGPDPPSRRTYELQSMKMDIDLDQTEREEKEALSQNLEEFQRARRKLLHSFLGKMGQNYLHFRYNNLTRPDNKIASIQKSPHFKYRKPGPSGDASYQIQETLPPNYEVIPRRKHKKFICITSFGNNTRDVKNFYNYITNG